MRSARRFSSISTRPSYSAKFRSLWALRKICLGGRTFDFRVKPVFPRKLSKEFLLVDLINNLDRLAESRDEVLARVKERAASLDMPRLQRAAREYGNVRTKRFFSETLHAT